MPLRHISPLASLLFAILLAAGCLPASPPRDPAWASGSEAGTRPGAPEPERLVVPSPLLPGPPASPASTEAPREPPEPGPGRAPGVIALASTHPRSARLPNGLFSPLPGGILSGYSADTGLDVAGFKKPVFAIAAGTIEYAEEGHTRWTGRGDTRFTVRLRLDAPLAWKGRLVTHAYYGHLSSLDFVQREGAATALHVEGGERLGVSGWANGSPHLHLGLMLDGVVTQQSWDYLLDEGEVRAVLCGMPNGARLP